MIYRDVYNFLVNKASSKEIDIVLNMIRHTDWDNNLRVSVKTLAKDADTTERYVRERIKKFLTIHKGKRILSYNNVSEEFPYKLLIGKSSIFYMGDLYVKKYKFLYSDKFMSLGIYEKRIILMSLMKMAENKQNRSFIRLDEVVYRNEFQAGLIPTKKELVHSAKKIERTFNGYIRIGYVGNIYEKKEMLDVQVDDVLFEGVLENNTERYLLRKEMFKSGYGEFLGEEDCIELEKVGKYVYNSLIKFSRDVKEVRDDLLYIARKVYTDAIGRLAGVIGKIKREEVEQGEMSAYFSSIVFSLITEELAKYDNECKTREWVMGECGTGDGIIEGLNKSKNILNVLKTWSEDWVRTRFKEGSVNKSGYEREVKKNNKLKEYVSNLFTGIINKERELKNKISEGTESVIERLKEQIEQYIDIKIEKMHPLYN